MSCGSLPLRPLGDHSGPASLQPPLPSPLSNLLDTKSAGPPLGDPVESVGGLCSSQLTGRRNKKTDTSGLKNRGHHVVSQESTMKESAAGAARAALPCTSLEGNPKSRLPAAAHSAGMVAGHSPASL